MMVVDHGSHDSHGHDDSHGDQADHGSHGHDNSHGDQADHGSHGDHGDHGDHAAQFRERFWVSLALAIPIVVYSEMIQEWLGFRPPAFPGDGLVAPGLGTVLFVYGGWPFLTGGLWEARQRQPGMMLLISLAITVAFVASGATTLGLFDLEFWWELAALIVVMLLGHWLEMRAIGQAQGALAALAELLPDEAERVTDAGIEMVPTTALQVDDLVLVRSGARVPADGQVEEGQAEFDESMVTGESRPVPRGTGDQVVAGTVATDSSVRVRITAVGDETVLSGVRRLVEEAQRSGSRAQVLADRAAALLFFAALGSGVLTLVVWALLGQSEAAVTRTVTVLVIACPHALGLAIPLVITLSTAMSARAGILVKDRLSLERMRQVDTVLFDKTGTLTKGRHTVTAVGSVDGDESRVLRLAGAAEADSEHPLAKAIVRVAEERVGTLPRASGFRSMTGRGVEADVDGAGVAVGGPSLLKERGLDPPPAMEGSIRSWEGRGAAVLHVLEGDRVIGAIALEDEVRPESKEAIDHLHRMGVTVAMITGDSRAVADAVAGDLGVDRVFAEVLPEDKDGAVVELQEQGHVVAMVGDGVNDAPALARADVGLAIGAGTDVAIESAGVVLASDDPRAVLDVIRLSRASYRKMQQNLAWAAGYNVVAIPLAAGVMAWAGITLAPAVGAILMSLSTIVVALNAQLLRTLKLGVRRGATDVTLDVESKGNASCERLG
jgi:Cu2+-exporting ATPase